MQCGEFSFVAVYHGVLDPSVAQISWCKMIVNYYHSLSGFRLTLSKADVCKALRDGIAREDETFFTRNIRCLQHSLHIIQRCIESLHHLEAKEFLNRHHRVRR